MVYREKDSGREKGGSRSLFGRLRSWNDRVFVHREVLLRSNDQVRYLKLSPRLQQGAALVLAAGVCWLAYSSVSYVAHGFMVATKDEEIATAKRAYFDLLSEVSEYHAQFSEITRNLESNQSYLLGLLEEEAPGDVADIAAVTKRLQGSSEARARVVVAREALRERLDSFQGELQEIAGRNSELQAQVQLMNQGLRASEAERIQVAEARRRLGERLRETEETLSAVRGERDDLDRQVASLQGALAEAEEQIASLSTREDTLSERVVTLEGDLATARQQAAEIAANADAQIAELTASATAREAELIAAAEAQAAELTSAANAREAELTAAARAREAELIASANAREAELIDSANEREAELIASAEAREAELIAAAKEREAELMATAEAREAELIAQAEDREAQLTALANAEVTRLKASTEELEAELTARISKLGSDLAAVTARRDDLDRERNLLQLRLAGLQQRMTDMRDVQQGIVDRLQERTATTVEAMEATVQVTGLDLEKVLDQVASTEFGKGGPFIPVDGVYKNSHPGRADELMTAVARLDIQMTRWEALQSLMRILPLAAPLQEYRVSSVYGQRTDPVNGRKSMHYGLDLAAPLRTPALATAPGVVTFAGWRGSYGRLVEIDHGFGIRTRYGHLKKIEVEEGDEVSTQDVIGLVGSSGRSTGPHVHYEVTYNEEAFDPQRFIDAGVRVFKAN